MATTGAKTHRNYIGGEWVDSASGETFDFADVLVDDLAARATRDELGARWSNHEHRSAQPDLEPRPGWAMGSAGIVRELLRYSRLSRGQPGTYAISWPDHPPVTT